MMLPVEAPRPSPAMAVNGHSAPREAGAATEGAGRATTEAAGRASDPPQAGAAGPTFARVLRGMGRELDAGEHAARDALSGRDLSAAELLVLQSRIYRYSEVVDLAAKLVDRASNGVRTVVQGQ